MWIRTYQLHSETLRGKVYPLVHSDTPTHNHLGMYICPCQYLLPKCLAIKSAKDNKKTPIVRCERTPSNPVPLKVTYYLSAQLEQLQLHVHFDEVFKSNYHFS